MVVVLEEGWNLDYDGLELLEPLKTGCGRCCWRREVLCESCYSGGNRVVRLPSQIIQV